MKDSRISVGKRFVAAVVSGVLACSLVPSIAFAATPNSTNSGDGGTPPSMPSGSGGGQGGSAPSGGMQGGGGADTQSFDYSGTYSGVLVADGQEQTSTGESLTASAADQVVALSQNGGTLTIANGAFEKSGDDTNGDNCNFYGVNSIVTAVGDSSMIYLSASNLDSKSAGSNGIFATDGATVYASSSTISTTGDNSRGLDATYGGTIIADGLDITTEGDHCASLATDRGGGYISATDTQLSTSGSGSPLLYSTGDIEVDSCSGSASGSQIAGMEGLNTILISNSTLSSTNTGTSGSDPVANGVIIYQSTSGDAETTTGEAATFKAANSTLESPIEGGAMFYLTNTTANVVLKNTTLDFDSDAAALLMAEGNDANNWGSAGSNGATVNFTGIGETLSGDVVADTISTANVYLLEDTTWTGATSIETNSNGTTSTAPITVNVDGSSTWVVTESCTLSNLNVAEGGKVVDKDGNPVTVVAAGSTVQQGSSDITVTVEGSYSTTVSVGEENSIDSDTIDRSDFDSYFDTDTAWTMGEESATAADDTSSSDGESLLDEIALVVASNEE